MKSAAWYGITVSILMPGWWCTFLATGNVPELTTEPYSISFHLAGEFVTAIGPIVGGVGLVKEFRWGQSVYLVAVGMVIYSEIVSPGYFAQQGQVGLCRHARRSTRSGAAECRRADEGRVKV